MRSRLSQLPSFDERVIKDELIVLLERSPVTSSYVLNRIQQIIIEVLSQPIIESLQEQIQSLETEVEDLEQRNSTLTHSHSKQHTKTQGLAHKYIVKNKQLTKQLSNLKNVENERNKLSQQHEKLQNINKQLTSENQKINEEKLILKTQINELNAQIVELKDKIKKSSQISNQNAQRVTILQQQLEKVKQLYKQTKHNETKLKKQGQKSQKQCNQVTLQLKKVQDELISQKNHRQKDRKTYTSKITQLNTNTKKLQKSKKQFLHLHEQNKLIKTNLLNLRQQFVTKINIVSKQTISNSYQMMDQIGERVNKQLKSLVGEISKNAAQVRICREEVRIKDDIIQKLQKVSSVQVMGNRELQKQLKIKKMEADNLRKELKKNYQDSQVKLMGLESNYRQILVSSARNNLR